MRISGGSLSGRVIKTDVASSAHPMSGKVRAAIFSVLGDISGLSVLDPYAGTGAISFEAISRGASSAFAIEKNRRTFLNLKKNIQELKLEDAMTAINANSNTWSNQNTDKKFDLIICDPPFDKLNEADLERFTRHLKSTSIMVISYSGRGSTPPVNGVVVVDNREYGDAALAFYRKVV